MQSFGTVTDVRTGPDGNPYLAAIEHGAVYEIHRRK